MHKQIFLDCDGVLADFDTAFINIFGENPRVYEDFHGTNRFWNSIRYDVNNFFEELPLMPDAMELFSAVEHLRPIILTGCPGGNWSQLQKLRWAENHFPGTPMITCRSREKRKYCRPGDILIDDFLKYRDLWEESNGIFVYHTDSENSIRQLKNMNIIL